MTSSPPAPHTVVSAESFGEGEEEESDLEGTAPTPKRRKLAKQKALKNSLKSGLYPMFKGIEGPSHDANPGDITGTIKKCARGFPVSLKGVKPPKGSYVSDRVDNKRYFVFQDRREVCFVTNVFPEHMDSQVARLQPEGVLRNQSVPNLPTICSWVE